MGKGNKNQRYPGMTGTGVCSSQAAEGVTGVTERQAGARSRKIPGGFIREPGSWNIDGAAAGLRSICWAAAAHPHPRGGSDPPDAVQPRPSGSSRFFEVLLPAPQGRCSSLPSRKLRLLAVPAPFLAHPPFFTVQMHEQSRLFKGTPRLILG